MLVKLTPNFLIFFFWSGVNHRHLEIVFDNKKIAFVTYKLQYTPGRQIWWRNKILGRTYKVKSIVKLQKKGFYVMSSTVHNANLEKGQKIFNIFPYSFNLF